MASKIEELVKALVQLNSKLLDLLDFKPYEDYIEGESPGDDEWTEEDEALYKSLVELTLPDFAEDFQFDEKTWGIPVYLQDALQVYAKKHGDTMKREEAEEVAALWLSAGNPLQEPVPLHVAVCAAVNLQSFILGSQHLDMRLWQYLAEGGEVSRPGMKTLKRKGKTYLHVRWDVIGQEMLGMRDSKDILNVFRAEREEACEIGLLPCVKASKVDKRLKGILLDLSLLLED